MKPVIGVTMNPDTKNGSRIGRIYSFYLEATRAAGGLPVALFDGEGEAAELAQKLDGLLLSGGDDMDPALFGEENTGSLGVDRRRDAMEIELIKAFCAQGKPVLGICRGMQVLAVALGGTLWQDIPAQTGAAHPSGTDHEIIVRTGTFLAKFLPERISVNSTHHQAVRVIPQGFMACAAAHDGVIEAMQAADGRRLFGVQFHPERLYARDERMLEIFRVLTER